MGLARGRGPRVVASIRPPRLSRRSVRGARPSRWRCSRAGTRSPRAARTALTVTFFDVGQGDAALVRSPGGARHPDRRRPRRGAGRDQAATPRASTGWTWSWRPIPHADHVAGLPAVLARFPVGLVLDPGCPGDSPSYAAFLGALGGVRRSRFGIRGRARGSGSGDVRIEVLGPEHCCARHRFRPEQRVAGPAGQRRATTTVLFPGDAEVAEQTELLRDERPLLRGDRPEGRRTTAATPRSPDSSPAVGARIAVVSVGAEPVRASRCRPSWPSWRSDGMRVFRTDRSGDVTVAFRTGEGVRRIQPRWLRRVGEPGSRLRRWRSSGARTSSCSGRPPASCWHEFDVRADEVVGVRLARRRDGEPVHAVAVRRAAGAAGHRRASRCRKRGGRRAAGLPVRAGRRRRARPDRRVPRARAGPRSARR